MTIEIKSQGKYLTDKVEALMIVKVNWVFSKSDVLNDHKDARGDVYQNYQHVDYRYDFLAHISVTQYNRLGSFGYPEKPAH